MICYDDVCDAERHLTPLQQCSRSRICPTCIWPKRRAVRSFWASAGSAYINWLRKRGIHPPARSAGRDRARSEGVKTPDHIAVTGDLVNISLPEEYARARDWLEALGDAARRQLDARQSRRLCAAASRPCRRDSGAITCAATMALDRLSVPAPARRRGADRAVDRRSRPARSWRPARLGERQLARLAETARSDTRAVSRRADPPSAG